MNDLGISEVFSVANLQKTSVQPNDGSVQVVLRLLLGQTPGVRSVQQAAEDQAGKDLGTFVPSQLGVLKDNLSVLVKAA